MPRRLGPSWRREETLATTKAELVARIDTYSRGHFGTGVTVRQFEDWIDEDLVPRGVPHGVQRGVHPNWEWNAHHYRRALVICRLRSKGIQRHTELRVQLWLLGTKDLPWDQVHQSILAEWRRRRSLAFRELDTTYDPRLGKPPTTSQVRALYHVLPAEAEVQKSFPPGLLDALPTMYAMARFGFGAEFFEQAMGNALQAMGLPANMAEEEAAILVGLMADPAEVEASAEASLLAADRETFENVRQWVVTYREHLQLLRAAGTVMPGVPLPGDFMDQAGDVFEHRPEQDGSLLLLVIFVHRSVQRGTHARALAWMANYVIRPLTRILNFTGDPSIILRLPEFLQQPRHRHREFRHLLSHGLHDLMLARKRMIPDP